MHRYSKKAHYVFLAYCFFTNFVIFAGLLVDATGAINLLVKDLMPEFSSMLLAILIVSLYLWEDPLYGGKDGVGPDLTSPLSRFLTIIPP